MSEYDEWLDYNESRRNPRWAGSRIRSPGYGERIRERAAASNLAALKDLLKDKAPKTNPKETHQ